MALPKKAGEPEAPQDRIPTYYYVGRQVLRYPPFGYKPRPYVSNRTITRSATGIVAPIYDWPYG